MCSSPSKQRLHWLTVDVAQVVALMRFALGCSTGDNPATMCLKSQPYRNTNTTGAATTPSCHDNPGRADDL
eukprot:XP_001695198.1 predicted protein [Chlamydomonas reinhardtii]